MTTEYHNLKVKGVNSHHYAWQYTAKQLKMLENWVKFLISCSAEVDWPIHMSGNNLGVLNHKELTEIVKFDSSPVINAVWRSLAHCHTEWWGVVSFGMVTVKIFDQSWNFGSDNNSLHLQNCRTFPRLSYFQQWEVTRRNRIKISNHFRKFIIVNMHIYIWFISCD